MAGWRRSSQSTRLRAGLPVEPQNHTDCCKRDAGHPPSKPSMPSTMLNALMAAQRQIASGSNQTVRAPSPRSQRITQATEIKLAEHHHNNANSGCMVARIFTLISKRSSSAPMKQAHRHKRDREMHAEYSNRQSEREANPCVNRNPPNERYQSW